mgnify:CR=1 FL=1
MRGAFEERRFARQRQHLCTGCARAIDQEDYTRTAIPQGTQHRRGFDVLKFCRDCRAVA